MKAPPAPPWTPEQVAALRAHFPKPDEVLTEIVAQFGPCRSLSAVNAKRCEQGLFRDHSTSPKGAHVAQAAAEGWPKPQGDRVFLRALYEALNPRKRRAA